MTNDPDADVRLAAFERLLYLARLYGGPIPWSGIAGGFETRGERFDFSTKAAGIFKPAGMQHLLSVKRVIPRKGRRVWYEDQKNIGLQSAGDLIIYSFMGSNPNDFRNRMLREAMEQQLPIIYFFGVGEATYEAIFPTFIASWDAVSLQCGLVFSPPADILTDVTPPSPEARRYALRTVRQRLHQAAFRERVLFAYGNRCALTGLPETRLIDAAHIVDDTDETLGQADVRNGICMSKIHHAAYDARLIGIDPKGYVHVAERLFELRDGPLLEGIKALRERQIRFPVDPRFAPDSNRLEWKFEKFRAQA